MGVQYGLVAFNEGLITAEQFLELNERIGGFDADGNIVGARSDADPVALRIAYETGRMNGGGGSLGAIPIIDARPYLDLTGDIHDSFRSFVTRARPGRGERARGQSRPSCERPEAGGGHVRLSPSTRFR